MEDLQIVANLKSRLQDNASFCPGYQDCSVMVALKANDLHPTPYVSVALIVNLEHTQLVAANISYESIEKAALLAFMEMQGKIAKQFTQSSVAA